MTLTTILPLLLLVLFVGHFLALFALSRSRPAPPSTKAVDAPLLFVFVLPCLNEHDVIARSVARLIESTDGRNDTAVLVIDDGSDDGTSDAVAPFLGPRVWLLRRDLPNARQGKGAALNAAVRYLRACPEVAARDPGHVIVTVLDADGRLSPNALYEVGARFVDERVGAVQVGVRMNNRHAGPLAVMQDIEFVTFTEIHQRARDRLGIALMGGNGQFVRLSALDTIGDEPWSDSLTEDLDLGLRLIANDWRTRYCPQSWVSQQAVVKFGRLVRQRTRWFQGHLQAWSCIPLLLRGTLGPAQRADLVMHLVTPVIMVVFTTAVTLDLVAGWLLGHDSTTIAGSPLVLAVAYGRAFALAPFVAVVYWLRDRDTSLPVAVALAHAYQLYTYLWLLTGWRAIGRLVAGRRGWAKTARTSETTGSLRAIVVPAVPTPPRRVTADQG